MTYTTCRVNLTLHRLIKGRLYTYGICTGVPGILVGWWPSNAWSEFSLVSYTPPFIHHHPLLDIAVNFFNFVAPYLYIVVCFCVSGYLTLLSTLSQLVGRALAAFACWFCAEPLPSNFVYNSHSATPNVIRLGAVSNAFNHSVRFYSLRANSEDTISSPQDLVKETKQEFDLIREEYLRNPKFFNYEIFRSLINGLYQAEGHIGAYFPYKDSLKLQFVLTIGQNYSKEAVLLLLQLHQALGGIGQFKLELASTGSMHIKLNITKSSDILNVVIPYLNQLYGQKAKDLITFKQIQKLYNLTNLRQNPQKALELIHLVYSLSPEGNQRSVTLQQKLAFLNNSFKETPMLPSFVDNPNLPSIPFILGFWLGDGTLGIILDDPKARYPMFYVKLYLSLYQQTSEYTLHMFTLFSQTLSNYFKVTICSNSKGMSSLSISGLKVATQVLPLLSQFSPYLYWKAPQFQLTYQVSQFVLSKSHLTKEGLLQIIHLLYNSPINLRKEPIEYWLDLIEQAFPAGSKPRRGSKA